jgi:uncharacterized membrane protein
MRETGQPDKSPSSSPFASLVLSIGSAFYALGIIGIGVQQFVIADFVPVILPSFPSWIPLRPFWVWVIGAFLIFTGAAILFRRAASLAGVILGIALLASLVLCHIPGQIAGSPRILGNWTNAFKILTLAGGAFVIAGSISDGKPGFIRRWFVAFGCFTLAITCVVFGIDHFLYVQYVAPLVPAWIPGHVFWTYFCGAALIAAGAGMITRILPHLAAGLLGSMIFVWLIVLHIPRAIADPHSGHGNEITSVFEALSFAGIAFILAMKK